jgi:hypothetical protein
VFFGEDFDVREVTSTLLGVTAFEAFYKNEPPVLFIILGKNSLKKVFARELGDHEQTLMARIDSGRLRHILLSSLLNVNDRFGTLAARVFRLVHANKGYKPRGSKEVLFILRRQISFSREAPVRKARLT